MKNLLKTIIATRDIDARARDYIERAGGRIDFVHNCHEGRPMQHTRSCEIVTLPDNAQCSAGLGKTYEIDFVVDALPNALRVHLAFENNIDLNETALTFVEVDEIEAC